MHPYRMCVRELTESLKTEKQARLTLPHFMKEHSRLWNISLVYSICCFFSRLVTVSLSLLIKIVLTHFHKATSGGGGGRMRRTTGGAPILLVP